MTFVIAGLVVLAVVVAAVLIRRRAHPDTHGKAETPPSTRPEPEPMTGLEAALAQVTDRDGRPIGEHIDAEAPVVDELRAPDDTGPVLRRALDWAEHPPTTSNDAEVDPTGDIEPASDDAAGES